MSDENDMLHLLCQTILIKGQSMFFQDFHYRFSFFLIRLQLLYSVYNSGFQPFMICGPF